jgi:hypothetical protein
MGGGNRGINNACDSKRSPDKGGGLEFWRYDKVLILSSKPAKTKVNVDMYNKTEHTYWMAFSHTIKDATAFP